MDTTLEGIDTRVTEAEQISDLRTERCKTLVQKRIQKKKKKKGEK